MKPAQITRKDIDIRLSNAENARQLGVDPSTISRARAKFGLLQSPLSKRRLPKEQKERREQIQRERSCTCRREQRAGIDWRMSNLEISMRQGVSVTQVIRWRKEARPTVRQYSKRDYVNLIIESEAKLAERKTVHEWLNMADVPQTELGKPICLLRRLAIALGVAPWQGDGKEPKQHNNRIVARFKHGGDPHIICEYVSPFFMEKICEYLNLTQPPKSGWSYHIEPANDTTPGQFPPSLEHFLPEELKSHTPNK